MAQKTDAELQTDRGVIESETTAGANTASRVGQHFEDIIDSKINKLNTSNDTVDPAQAQDVATKAYVDSQVGGGGGHVIEDEGTPLTQRTKLNFVGAGVTVTDDSGDDASVVTIPAASAILASSISDGDTTHAPDGNSVFDALALKVATTGNETIAGIKTFSSDPIIPDEAYDATAWNGSLEPATKNAIRDKIETIVSTVGVQDLFIPAAAMWPRVTNGCAQLAKTEIATSLFNIQTLDFDQTTQEYAQFQITLPRKWNNATVTFLPYWTADSGSGGVVFEVSGGAYSNDDALTVAFGTAQSSTDTLIATNDLHIGPESSAITLAGSPADADFLAFQISRVTGNGSDTLTGDAKLLGISIRITTDAPTDA